jgi:hypothetical protein
VVPVRVAGSSTRRPSIAASGSGLRAATSTTGSRAESRSRAISAVVPSAERAIADPNQSHGPPPSTLGSHAGWRGSWITAPCRVDPADEHPVTIQAPATAVTIRETVTPMSFGMPGTGPRCYGYSYIASARTPVQLHRPQVHVIRACLQIRPAARAGTAASTRWPPRGQGPHQTPHGIQRLKLCRGSLTGYRPARAGARA